MFSRICRRSSTLRTSVNIVFSSLPRTSYSIGRASTWLRLHEPNKPQGSVYDRGGDCGLDIQSCTARHADSSHHPYGSRAGEPQNPVSPMKDQSGAEKSNPLHDVRSHLPLVRTIGSGETSESIVNSARPCRSECWCAAPTPCAAIAFNSDDGAHRAGHQEARGGALGKRICSMC